VISTYPTAIVSGRMLFLSVLSTIIERLIFAVERLIIMFFFVFRDDQVSDLNPESRLEYVGILR
jgi:hypothetical protein